MSALIEASELVKIINDVKMIDATYGIPGFPQSAIQNHANARIGDAVFFDIDQIADPNAEYAHTIPSADDFAKAISALGISNSDRIVVYDQTGISFAAARVWWMFRTFGHDNIQILNGGLPAWTAMGLPLNSDAVPTPENTIFTATMRADLYRSFEDVEDNTATGREIVVDARAAARFSAPVRNAEGDAVPANIPGSINRPYQDLLDAGGRLRPANDLTEVLEKESLPADKKLVASCGSGVTACVVALGFYQIGKPDVAVFDGSWTEWSDKLGLR